MKERNKESTNRLDMTYWTVLLTMRTILYDNDFDYDIYTQTKL